MDYTGISRMIVKIRVGSARPIRRAGVRNRHAALTAAALLTPASVMAFALGCWRLAADLNWTHGFAIEHGPFSHWQVWITLAFGIQVVATILNRYADDAEPGD